MSVITGVCDEIMGYCLQKKTCSVIPRPVAKWGFGGKTHKDFLERETEKSGTISLV